MPRPFEFLRQEALPIIDDFDRSNSSTLGGSWSEAVVDCGSGLAVVSNRVEKESGTNDQSAAWTGFSGRDLLIEFTLTGAVNAIASGLVASVANTLYGYEFYINWPTNTNWKFWRRSAAGWTDLGSFASGIASIADGDRFGARVTMSGRATNLELYHRTSAGNWKTAFRLTDPTPDEAVGPWYPGIMITGTANQVSIDDFRAARWFPASEYPSGVVKKKKLARLR